MTIWSPLFVCRFQRRWSTLRPGYLPVKSTWLRPGLVCPVRADGRIPHDPETPRTGRALPGHAGPASHTSVPSGERRCPAGGGTAGTDELGARQQGSAAQQNTTRLPGGAAHKVRAVPHSPLRVRSPSTTPRWSPSRRRREVSYSPPCQSVVRHPVYRVVLPGRDRIPTPYEQHERPDSRVRGPPAAKTAHSRCGSTNPEPGQNPRTGTQRLRIRRAVWLSGPVGTPRPLDHWRGRTGVATRGPCSRLPVDQPG